MSDDFKRTRTSKPGAAIETWRIEMPQWVNDRIADNLRRGREQAQAEADAEWRSAVVASSIAAAAFIAALALAVYAL